LKLIKLSKTRAKIVFESEDEKYLIDFLYRGKVVKGAYAYKKNEFIEIDFKAYSTDYQLFFKEDNKPKVEQVDDTYDFLN